MKIENQWCVIMLYDDGPAMVQDAMGPYATKQEAVQFCKEFNDEYDGSPWRAIVRPITLLKVHA